MESAATAYDAANDEDDLQASLEGMSQLLAGTLSLEQLLTRVAQFAVQAIPGADGAGVTMYEAGRRASVVSSEQFVREVDDIQYDLDEGPCVSAAAEGSTVVSGSLGGEARWPRFGPRAGRLGVHSTLSMPLVLADEVLGALNVYARAKDVFDVHAVRLAELFVAPAAVAVHNARVLAQAQTQAAHLQHALTSRATIDQAIGILRARSGASAAEAFATLREISQRENVKLNLVAQRTVDEAVRRARARHSAE